MRKLASIACSVAVLGIAGTAGAHSFVCSKTVNGSTTFDVTSYPTTLHFDFVITNSFPTLPSTYTAVSDPLLPNFTFEPVGPYEVPIGGSVADSFDVTVATADECMTLAATDGVDDGVFANTFTVSWESGGQASCSAQVTCAPPPAPPPPTVGATRTPGFYKTHITALQACLDMGTVDAGTIQISTINDALGLLWGSPASFDSGAPRADLDKARFLLERQLLVATCNTRLFGSEPTSSTLLTDAVSALNGTDCQLMLNLAEQLDAFNNSGDEQAFPSGFNAGPATPRDAAAMATDPTSPSGGQCSSEPATIGEGSESEGSES